MSTDRETTRVVRSWLEEGVTRLPDRVLDVVLDQVPATPQRRSRWPARRSNPLNIYVKLVAGVAAILVVAVVGYQLLPGRLGPGSPTTAPSVTPMPDPTEASRLPEDGPIDAGTYRVESSRPILVTFPTGWVGAGPSAARKHPGEPTELGLEVYPADLRVFADACASDGSDASVGPTAQDLLNALSAQKNSVVSAPVEVTLGNLPAFKVWITSPAELDLAQCSTKGLQIWVDAARTTYLAFGGDPAPVAVAYIADSPAGRVVLFTSRQAKAKAADFAELEAIIASIRVAQ